MITAIDTSVLLDIFGGDPTFGTQSKGGKRTRVAADFLIGAHALSQADRFLTRDRGFYRTCFSKLKIMYPSVRSN